MNMPAVIPAPKPKFCNGSGLQDSRLRGNDSDTVIPASGPESCSGGDSRDSNTSDRRLRGNDSVTVIPASEPESCNGGDSRDSDTSDRRLRGNDSQGGINRKRGFTLLEVMIALLVITLGMGAVINTTGESGWKSAQLKQGTIANWVAQNQIAEYRAKRTWNNVFSRTGDVEMANVEWVWKMKISKTDDPSLRRLDVEVFIKGEDVLKASATGFIGRL